uniref:Protein Smg homolog n=1 Tax=mine drainage metagenome TaxID=410659 RepID=E6QVF8_9ZZZZ
MFEILLFLFGHYAQIEATPDRNTLAIKLNAAGFEMSEIEQILDWLGNLNEINSPAYPEKLPESHAERVYTTEELHRLDLSGLSFLAFMQQSGMINAMQREWIIHQVMALKESEYVEQQLRWITLVALWSQHPDQSILLLEDLLFNQDATPTLH